MQHETLQGRLGILVSGKGTYFAFVSEPGDSLGQGAIGVVRNPTMEVRYNWTDSRGEHIQILGSSAGSPLMELSIQPWPHVATGAWSGARTFPFQGAGVPGIKFMMNGRTCDIQHGSFAVHEIRNWGEWAIGVIHVTFATNCNGAIPALRGEVSVRR